MITWLSTDSHWILFQLSSYYHKATKKQRPVYHRWSLIMSSSYYHIIFRWLFDYHWKIIRWSCQDHLMIIWGGSSVLFLSLRVEYLLITCSFYDYCLLNISRSSVYNTMIIWWLPHDYLLIIWLLLKDHLIIVWWLSDDHLKIIW